MAADLTITPGEILNKALAKEKAAFDYYDKMLKSSNIELIRDLLQDLKNEEYKHMKMIETRIARMNLD